jgi:N utilization substance protein B
LAGGRGAPPPDREHFARVVRGVIARQDEIDRTIDSVLKAGWPLARLDATVRAILRAGAFELFACEDVPPRVALNEYLDVAHAFFSGDEASFINGVLDHLARRWRGEALRDPSVRG